MVRYVLPWPVSLNHMYVRDRSGQVRLTDRAVAWREEAILRVRATGLAPPLGPLRVELRLWGPKGRWDCDNFVKLTADAVFAALSRDDRDVVAWQIIRSEKPWRNPVMEVLIAEGHLALAPLDNEPPVLPPLEEVAGVRA